MHSMQCNFYVSCLRKRQTLCEPEGSARKRPMKEKGRPALRRTMSLRCCPGARRRCSSACSHARGSWFSSALGSCSSLQCFEVSVPCRHSWMPYEDITTPNQ